MFIKLINFYPDKFVLTVIFITLFHLFYHCFSLYFHLHQSSGTFIALTSLYLVTVNMLVNIVVYLLVLFPIVCPLTTPRAFKQQKLSLRPFHLYMKTDVANDIMSQRISLLVNSNPSPPLLEFIRCAVSSLKREIFLNQLTDKSDAVEVLFADTQQQDNKVSQQV